MTVRLVQTHNYHRASKGQTTQPIGFRATCITIFCMLVTAPSFRSNQIHLSTPQCCISTRPHGVNIISAVSTFISELHHSGVMSTCLWVAAHRQWTLTESSIKRNCDTINKGFCACSVAVYRRLLKGFGNGWTSEIMGDRAVGSG
jgi:hypothetical protein